MKTLEKHGLTVIPPDEELQLGHHEVVKEIEGEDKDIGRIASLAKQGFMLHGKVIRPAQVSLNFVSGYINMV
jgi:molecular chaperone GrpE